MKQIKLGLAVLAVFVLSAIVATAAQAKGGPFYKINKVRLLATQTEEFTAIAQTPFVLTKVGMTIECTGLSVKKGAQIIGSTGLNSSTSKETIELSGCTLKGNAKVEGECRLAAADGGKIVTEPLKNTLDYGKKVPADKDQLLVLFQPEKGAVIARIRNEPVGTGQCIVLELVLEGSVLGEAQNEKGEPYQLKVNTKETVINLVHFPSKGTEACTEAEGVVSCIKPKLTDATKVAQLKGSAGLTLVNKNIWGIFSE